MYIIFAAIIVIVFIFFWQTIYNIFTLTTTNASKSSSSLIGNLWFVCLFIINLSIISFIYIFYYYKSTTPGQIGLAGQKGYDGKTGEPCYIKSPNCINNES
jgi:hypothetical protein